MIARRSFFTKLGLLAAGIVTGPQVFIPKLEPARWKFLSEPLRFPPTFADPAQMRAVVHSLIGAAPPYLRPWDGIGCWDWVEGKNGLLTWTWTGPGAPPSAFPAYEGGPNPQAFLEARGLVYPPELPKIVKGVKGLHVRFVEHPDLLLPTSQGETT